MGGNWVGTTGETFAALVRRWRYMANLTQEGLAARSGLSPRSIQNLERGRVSRPRHDSVRLLADALGLAGADRAAFVHAAWSGTPAPVAAWRGVPVADDLRRLVAQSGRDDSRCVDLRGLPPTTAPDVVLERLLTALGVTETGAAAV